MIVDPYNGYLFWMSEDPTTAESVVYKADLALAEENDSLPWQKAEVVHRAKNIRTFEIDYVRFRLYALDVGTQSIYALDIDCEYESEVHLCLLALQWDHIHSE